MRPILEVLFYSDMLGDTARPQDLMLAYDADFGGFSSLGLKTGGGPSTAADGRYEDFSARLDRFVRDNPRLGFPSETTGAGGPEPFRLGDFVEEERFSLADYAQPISGSGLSDVGCSVCGGAGYSDEFDAEPQFGSEIPFLGGDTGWESAPHAGWESAPHGGWDVDDYYGTYGSEDDSSYGSEDGSPYGSLERGTLYGSLERETLGGLPGEVSDSAFGPGFVVSSAPLHF